jgi:hypothetical protein
MDQAVFEDRLRRAFLLALLAPAAACGGTLSPVQDDFATPSDAAASDASKSGSRAGTTGPGDPSDAAADATAWPGDPSDAASDPSTGPHTSTVVDAAGCVRWSGPAPGYEPDGSWPAQISCSGWACGSDGGATTSEQCSLLCPGYPNCKELTENKRLNPNGVDFVLCACGAPIH